MYAGKEPTGADHGSFVKSRANSPRFSVNHGIVNEDIWKHGGVEVDGIVYQKYRSQLHDYVNDVDLSDSLLRLDLHNVEELLPTLTSSASNRDILKVLETECGAHLCYIVLRDSCHSDVYLNSIVENMRAEAEKRLTNGCNVQVEDHAHSQPPGLSDGLLLMHLTTPPNALMVSPASTPTVDNIHVSNRIKDVDQEVPLLSDGCIDDHEDYSDDKEGPRKPFKSTTKDDECVFIGPPHHGKPFAPVTSITTTLSNPGDSLGSEYQYTLSVPSDDDGSYADFSCSH